MAPKIKAPFLILFLIPLFVYAAALENPTAHQNALYVQSEVISDRVIDVQFNIDPGKLAELITDTDQPRYTRWVAVRAGGPIEAEITAASLQHVNTKAVRTPDAVTMGEIFSIGEPVEVYDLHFYPLTLNPIAADFSENQEVISKLDIRVNIPSGQPDMSSLPHHLRRMWGDLLINNFGPGRDDNGRGTGYVYVVPDDQRVTEVLEDLIDWRKRQGFNVRVMQMQEQFDAEFLLEELRNIHEWSVPLEYICLVGDTEGEFAVPTALHGTSDYHYCLLDTDDPYPDAAVGRISYNSIGELTRIVRKILEYETEPDFNDFDWMTRGAVCSGSARSGFSTILVNRWIRDEMYRFGYSNVDTFWYTMGGSVENFIRRSFDEGISFLSYRGFTGIEDFTPHEAGRMTNTYLPVALLLGCNTGVYNGVGAGHTEALLRAEGGAIGAIGSSTVQTRINYNNAMASGYFRGVLEDHVCNLGWTLNRAKMEMFATYGDNGEQWGISHAYWTNLMGDPATVVWLGEPREVQIQAPQQVEMNLEPFQVRVTHNGEPVPDVRVGIYKEFELATASYTDEFGFATIVINPNLVNEGEATITVSGDRIYPSDANIQLIETPRLMTYRGNFIQDDEWEPHEGNNDGVIQPLEVFGMNINLSNVGNQAIEAPIDFTLTSRHPALRVLEGQVRLNINLNPNGMITPGFLLEATADFPDNEPIELNLNAVTDEDEWDFVFTVTGEAPQWEFVQTDPVEVQLQPGFIDSFSVIVVNNGSIDAPEAECELICENEFIEIMIGDGVYPELEPGEQDWADQDFEIMTDGRAPRDLEAEFTLILQAGNGLRSEMTFTLYGPDGNGGGGGDDDEDEDITGPDEYGYYAIDSGDFESNLSPVYNWLEIDPNLNGPGNDTGILDQREDDDESVLVDLPFPFTYYGEEFEELTICSNGWAAFGNQTSYVDFRNLSIGSPQGPKAQLCPFWDDLYQPADDGGVYYYYDESQHRFIVEWSQMRRYVGPGNPGAEETFQLILLDPRWHRTMTDDGHIIFQYLEVTNEVRIDGYSTPYATIGIGNLDDSGGLQYGFWNEWAEGAEELENQFAIRFATDRNHALASVNGSVMSLGGMPVTQAVVRSTTGGWVLTNDAGMFNNLEVIADTPFRIEASKDGWNTVLSDELQLEEFGFAQIELNMPQPVLNFNIAQVIDTLDVGADQEYALQIGNNGNGPLEFDFNFVTADGEQERDNPDDFWDRILSFNVTDEVNDNRILGAAYTNDGFWITGGMSGGQRNRLYRFSVEGEPQGRVFQPCDGLWGMHDLAWDGEFLYGGCEETIYKMNDEGEVVATINSPLIPPRALAVDPESGDLFTANDGDPIHRLDSEGNVLQQFTHRLRPYGMAWHPQDVDGYSLYIFSADGESNLMVSKMNPDDGDIEFVTELELEDGDRAGGCEISLNLDTRQWNLITIIQNPAGDRVEVFNAGGNFNWLTIEPQEGDVAPNQATQATLTLSADGLDQGNYEVDLIMAHNAMGGNRRIPIRLLVEPQFAGVPDETPQLFTLHAIYPNPANNSGVIKFALPHNEHVRISLWNSMGRKVTELVNEEFSAGEHSYTFFADDVPSGIYLVRMQTGQGVLTRKFALMK